MELQIITKELLADFLQIAENLGEKFNDLKESEITSENFSFYTSVSSVFSSKIEGEDIDLDSFIKHKKLGVEFQPDYTKKIDDLYDAYVFAKSNRLNEDSLSQVHRILSKNLLSENQQGVSRKGNMYVLSDDGNIEYVAISPYQIDAEMTKFFFDLDLLLKEAMSVEEVFYYASFLHLVFVKIHPWNDGNGRTGRLLEKWFIAEKLGEKAWFLQSEKYYYLQHQGYYNAIRKLGLEYEMVDYSKAMDFLLMLKNSLN